MRVTSTGSSYGSTVLWHSTSQAMPNSLSSRTRRNVRIGSTISMRSGPDAVVVDVRPQPAGQADVVLPALVADADEAVEHVVVLVQPDVRRQAHVAVGVAQAHVVAVVPLRIAAGDAGEGLGDLVQRVFVESGEHGSLLSGADVGDVIVDVGDRPTSVM